MRLKALAEIYKIRSFAQLCNLKIFVKILLNSANFWQNLQWQRKGVWANGASELCKIRGVGDGAGEMWRCRRQAPPIHTAARSPTKSGGAIFFIFWIGATSAEKIRNYHDDTS